MVETCMFECDLRVNGRRALLSESQHMRRKIVTVQYNTKFALRRSWML
jgi:hypothetical protein